MNLLKKLFSFEQNNKYCKIKVLGIKIKKIALAQQIEIPQHHSLYQMAQLQNLYAVHSKTFSQYKNINHGKDVVLLATGPTLQYFEPIKDAAYIGVNRSYQYDKAKLDYIFTLDGTATKSYIDEIDKLDDVTKFYGLMFLNEEYRPNVRIPEYHLLSKNSHRFYCYFSPSWDIRWNLETFPLYANGSISLPALHFALWTHPKRIYIVGCDTTAAPYWDGGDREEDYLVQAERINNLIINGFEKIKKFADLCYPDVEIISLNPVGLKGIFHDVYTTSYLRKHPEIDAKTVEILEDDSIKRN